MTMARNFRLTDRTRTDGTWTGSTTVPADAAPGPWILGILVLKHPVGNNDPTLHTHHEQLTFTQTVTAPDAPVQLQASPATTPPTSSGPHRSPTARPSPATP